MAGENLHVVMLPWSAFGHLMPFFQLSVAMARAGVHVSFISTPRNIERLPQIPPNLKPSIDLVSFPLQPPATGLLPDGAEATVDIPFEKIQYLKSAYDNLRYPVEKFVSDHSPDYLIIDVIPYWAAEIALKNHVPLVLFSVFSASPNTFVGPPEYLTGAGRMRLRPSPESLLHSPEWVTFDSSLAFKKHEAITFFNGFYGSNGTDMSDSNRLAKILGECQLMAIRTCDEYEGQYLNLLSKMLRKPVIPTGLLPPETGKPNGKSTGEAGSLPHETGKSTGKSTGEIFEWLENQKPKSVVFVGFGSECKLTKDQTYEIAYGVELSELPFLWVLRKPEWAAEAMDALPQGFGERTAGRGTVTIGWAPQTEILGNPAIGGSLFHGGWGSAIEMLQFGHALVVLPFIVDQPLNARLLVEKGLAMEVERGNDGSFSREGIKKALRGAMASAEGEKLRANAGEATLVFGDKELHERYFARFVDFLKNGAVKSGN